VTSPQFYAILDGIHKIESNIYAMDEHEWMLKAELGDRLNKLRKTLRTAMVKNEIAK